MDRKEFEERIDRELESKGWGKVPVSPEQQTQFEEYFKLRGREDCMISLRKVEYDYPDTHIIAINKIGEDFIYYHAFGWDEPLFTEEYMWAQFGLYEAGPY